MTMTRPRPALPVRAVGSPGRDVASSSCAPIAGVANGPLGSQPSERYWILKGKLNWISSEIAFSSRGVFPYRTNVITADNVLRLVRRREGNRNVSAVDQRPTML